MLVAKVDGIVNDCTPIWKYELANNVFYLVREFETSEDGKHSYIIKAPDEKLYQFFNCDKDVNTLFSFIENEKEKAKQYECDLKSIYEENIY